MLPVAIATECDDFDGEVYRVLLERVLEREVTRWKSDFRFSGWKSVCGLGSVYLAAATRDGVEHALLAVDNDGGSKRRPEHDAAHDGKAEAGRPEDGCAFCLLKEAIAVGSMKSCIVVPVQTIETWLLVIRGNELGLNPEAVYHRRLLKERFFGKPLPPVATRTERALEQIRKPNALDVLRERRSLQLFEEQLAFWR